MNSVPDPRLSRTDGCPECVAGYHRPHRIEPLPDDGFIAWYECSNCGHKWWTSWSDSLVEGLE